ncbi:autotransporter outer membrane beta-barrel domain-containing protein [Castellaniella sp.]|uniref:autotransporter outer membrane beta-barrel domain-containing protein n=1 Tax=Castellaniella sp. TaxID=1955812 RepID=UPI002AFEEBAA|nr:autotransporter outer membrane beta-barrel domain-containing protein [Castellaniella sp.]
MTSIRLRPCAAALACLATSASPAWAANSGGSTGTACGTTTYIGACATQGDATGGRITLDTDPGAITEGGNAINGTAYGNIVTVGGSNTFPQIIFGGHGYQAHSNTITIGDNSNLTASKLYGGYSIGGSASGNAIAIQGNAHVGSTLYGGYSKVKGDASGNQLTFSGNSDTTLSNPGGFGGYSQDGNANGNTILVTDQARTLGFLTGGMANTNGNANGNIILITGHASIASSLTGGNVVMSGNAIGNHIILSGNIVFSAPTITAGSTQDGNAMNNTVSILDKAWIASGKIYAGQSQHGTVQGNRIILAGTPNLSNAELFGGYSIVGAPIVIRDNTLEVRSAGLTAKSVAAFDTYQFLLPKGVSATTTMLTIGGGAATDLGSAGTLIDVANDAGILATGTQATLLSNAAGLSSSTYSATPTQVIGHQGFALDYQFDVVNDGTALIATVQGANASAASKAPVESRASTLALANQGADLAAGLGMSRARSAAASGDWAAFGAIAGGHSRYESGSHVTVDGVSLMAGVARRFAPGTGELTVGPFIEAGYGSHDSDNDFSGQSVRGSGNSHYVGAGVLAHYDFDRATPDLGAYAEASLRAGRLDSDWRSNDLAGANGQSASYDGNATYIGAHLGAGWRLPLGERSSADLYAQYFWTRLGSDSADVAGAPYDFKATDSSRTRLGARFIHAYSDQTRVWAGAAWEHEFDSVARATVYGFDTPSPSLKGDTGVFELGVTLTPTSRKALSIDIGLQAYIGQRQGVGGGAALKYAF